MVNYRNDRAVELCDSLGLSFKMGLWAMVVQSASLEKNQAFLLLLGDFVHQVQKERGCASLYLDSMGKTFSNQLVEQICIVDDSVRALEMLCSDAGFQKALPEDFSNRLTPFLYKLSTLNSLREQINTISIRYIQAVNQYTFGFIMPAIDLMIEISQRETEHQSSQVPAFANFIQWKERVGMERAVGSRGFYTFSFRNQEFYDRFATLALEQKTYFNTFKALATEEQATLLDQAVDMDDLQNLNEINQLIEDGAPANEIERFTSEAWFALLTRMIDGLRNAEIAMVKGLATAPEPTKEKQTKETSKGRMARYRPFLKTLPTFSSLEEAELDELLSFAQIREHGKDKLIFLRDEPATRLYIVLDGWVKVYNGLETGEEAILQMLGKGETLLESAVFLNVPAPISAQVVEPALLLSIPAPVIRQRLQSSPTLALNMLNTVSLRSQRLVHQIELSRLKTAQERVGWFLLRIALNQDERDHVLHLPYEKSIIASYLDMRPETFSRTLQKFRKDGFEIASDHVTVPDDRALCKFCDVELASQCDHEGSSICPRQGEYGFSNIA
jgi:CRP-like cAMP-binding protein